MLKYWAEEPPAHVILALRYLGPGKRKGKVSEAQARKDVGAMAQLPGMGRPKPLPANLRQMIEDAEKLKKNHKGFGS